MITDAQYKTMMARAETLACLDPESDTPEARELVGLVDELTEYERAHFPQFFFGKDDVAALRGGYPPQCSFCGKVTPIAALEPEEAGDWVCVECLERWAIEEGRPQDAAFWKARKEALCSH